MDLEKIIKEEAPKAGTNDSHDNAYAEALRNAYIKYKDILTKEEIEFRWNIVKAKYDGTHKSVAETMILYYLYDEKLLEEKEKFNQIINQITLIAFMISLIICILVKC
jgi:hypothetical protein